MLGFGDMIHGQSMARGATECHTMTYHCGDDLNEKIDTQRCSFFVGEQIQIPKSFI
jgi:hypothetical protein